MAVDTSVLDPRSVEFVPWAASLVEALEADGVQQPVSEARWLEWAASLFESLNSEQVLDPRGFSTWRAWAEQLVQGLT